MELPYSRIANKSRIEPLVRAYLFEGKEDALKQEALLKLTAQVVDKDSESFDLEIFEGRGLTAERLFTAAGVPPFTSPKRMVIVRRANTIAAAEQEAIAAKLPKLPESAVVVFFVPAPELKDGRPKAGSQVAAKLSKAIGSVGAVVTFAALRADDAAREIGQRIAESGKKIDGPALRKIVSRMGNDLSILYSEVQKLIDYAGDNPNITVQDVELVTGETPEERIWNLLDAVGARNAPAALRLLREVLENGASIDKEVPRTLAMILRQLRFIWQVRALTDQGQRLNDPDDGALAELPTDNNVVAFCRRQQFQAPRLREQARNFTLADLEQCFEYAASTDLAIKGVEGDIQDPAIALELLVINLCRRRRGTTQTRNNP